MQDNNTPQTTPEAPVPVTPLPTETAPSPAAPPPLAAPKKGLPKLAKIIIGIVVGIIALIVIGVVALLLIVNAATKAPLDVSNKFFDDLQANNSSAAYQLTSKEFKQSTTELQLESLFTQLSSYVEGEEKVTAKKIESKNGLNQAAVAYSVDNNGETRYVRVVLRESDSKWEVINFKTSSTKLEAIVE